ncbi:hypothetical protein N658DRAFT_217375 [Parathielavia hyrcaniae]|uniref:Uncharacterized protein n=1 Tax=Parathielavia hyrcaniae TaxID=113614 RepID=A0AAN6PV79_9PEZI|nr:hypothetical protein N658DRAFT_217375 [Parathielavia hyrcaniae]
MVLVHCSCYGSVIDVSCCVVVEKCVAWGCASLGGGSRYPYSQFIAAPPPPLREPGPESRSPTPCRPKPLNQRPPVDPGSDIIKRAVPGILEGNLSTLRKSMHSASSFARPDDRGESAHPLSSTVPHEEGRRSYQIR